LHTLKINPASIDFLIGLDIAPDDQHIILVGGKFSSLAYWAIVDVATFTVQSEFSKTGQYASDAKWVSTTDYIVGLSNGGNIPFTEYYQRYSGGVLQWTLDLVNSNGQATGGFANSKIVLIDGGNFASFWCPNTPSNQCVLLRAS